MRIPLFDRLGQLQVAQGIARIRLAQDGRQADGVQPVGRR
jgi:hypothetical protein